MNAIVKDDKPVGDSIEPLEASIEQAKGIVDRVKDSVEHANEIS